MEYSNLTKEQIILSIQDERLFLFDLSKELQDDDTIVLEAVKKNGWRLCDASERLKDNKKIVLEAIKKNGELLRFASTKLKNDKEIVLEAIKNDGSLEYVSEKLKDDKEVVLVAVKQNGYSLMDASDRLKNDKELLEILEKEYSNYLYSYNKKKLVNWYKEKMEVLANIREKELMEKSVDISSIKSQKIKF